MHFRLRTTLEDIRHNIEFAQKIVDGLTLETFEGSQISFYAATRCLAIVSEATRRLPEEFRMRRSSLPWRQIIDAGNFYRHDYGNVAEERIWTTIHDHLPALLAVVIAELEENPEP